MEKKLCETPLPEKTELIESISDVYKRQEIDGVMSEEMEARVWELRMPDLPQEEQLAVELDRLSYDYDTVLYHLSLIHI